MKPPNFPIFDPLVVTDDLLSFSVPYSLLQQATRPLSGKEWENAALELLTARMY